MDQNTRLNHAVFQLTPTRTRCDLVIFAGSRNEKLASGLLEPFLLHLKAAKEQVSKGGYSITLQVSKGANSHAPWFTKGTWERFVRFVSTPEILERVVTIESEILQIENSVQCSESVIPNLGVIKQSEANTAATAANIGKPIVLTKSKDDSNGEEAGQEENSKLRLQRVLETRKAVLRKEQGMAYARASAAGFEMDHIDGLVSFSEAFGASRLREACLNFKELCKKKLEAGLWLDELAAMEASPQPVLFYAGTSGITLTSESSLSQDSIPKVLSSDASRRQPELSASIDAAVTDSARNHINSQPNQGTVFPVLDQHPSAGDEFSNGKTQVPLSYLSHSQQYMYNFQNHIVQPGPLYQGCLMPNMQLVPPYNPVCSGNVPQPQIMEDSRSTISRETELIRKHNLSSETKDRSINGKGSDSADSTLASQDLYDSNSDKNSSSMTKGPRKKSSKVVVLRNINYIKSIKSDGGKDDVEDESVSEDDLMNDDSLKQQVEDAVDSFEKHHKATQRRHKKKGGHKHPNHAENDPIGNKIDDDNHAVKNWHAFENLLMRDGDSGSVVVEQGYNGDTLDIQDEHFIVKNFTMNVEVEKQTRKKPDETYSFIVTERNKNNEGPNHIENLEWDTNYCRSMKNTNSVNEEFLFPQRMESRNVAQYITDYSQESSLLKNQRGGDWSEKLDEREETVDFSSFHNDQTSSLGENRPDKKKYEGKCLIDDSFVVPIRSGIEEQLDGQWRTDVSIEESLPSAGTHLEGGLSNKIGKSSSYEPDDLYILLDRNCGAGSAEVPWTSDIDYNIDLPVIKIDKSPGIETNGSVDYSMAPNCRNINLKKEGDVETKNSKKGSRPTPFQGYLGKSRSKAISKNGKSSMMIRNRVPMSKKEKEEEERKRVEELLIQRQKRIAQRIAPSSSKQVSSKPPKEASKTATLPVKHNKEVGGSSFPEAQRLSLHKSDNASSTKSPHMSERSKHKGTGMERSSTVRKVLI